MRPFLYTLAIFSLFSCEYKLGKNDSNEKQDLIAIKARIIHQADSVILYSEKYKFDAKAYYSLGHKEATPQFSIWFDSLRLRMYDEEVNLQKIKKELNDSLSLLKDTSQRKLYKIIYHHNLIRSFVMKQKKVNENDSKFIIESIKFLLKNDYELHLILARGFSLCQFENKGVRYILMSKVDYTYLPVEISVKASHFIEKISNTRGDIQKEYELTMGLLETS